MGDGHVGRGAASEYRLFAELLTPTPRSHEDQEDAEREKRRTGAPVGRRQIEWVSQLPFVARSIVLTTDALLVAGGESLPNTASGDTPGTLWIACRKDGAKQEACPLPAQPILDGMALTDYGIFVSTIDGAITCLRTKDSE